jgi:AcrR family transcriptional regulator
MRELAAACGAAALHPAAIDASGGAKDEIGEAIVEHRLQEFRAITQKLDALNPMARLEAFMQMTLENAPDLAKSRCPFGTFCSEIHKQDGMLAEKAGGFLAEPLGWVEAQFAALGKEAESRRLAVHLFSALQGVSVLAHSIRDEGLVALETERLRKWLSAL